MAMEKTGMSHKRPWRGATLWTVRDWCVKSSRGLQHHKIPFAHDVEYQRIWRRRSAIEPTALIGVSTIGGGSPRISSSLCVR